MRLFIAIDLPTTVKDQLATLQTHIPTARWVKRQQMHLTLFFLGETHRQPEIQEALASVHVPPFAMTLAGTGRFPRRQRQPPRVLWVGIDAEPALAHLHDQVRTVLAEIGFELESRPFHPHITLARLNARAPLPEVDAFLNAHDGFRITPITITEFVLFSSVLSPQGARYEREAVFTLPAV